MDKQAWIVYMNKQYEMPELDGVFIGTRQEIEKHFRTRAGEVARIDHTDDHVKVFVPGLLHGEIQVYHARCTAVLT